MTQVTFVMEQHIGHRTYYENLRRAVDNDPRLQPTWIEVTYHDPAGRWYRLPGLPASTTPMPWVSGPGQSEVIDAVAREVQEATE